MVSLRIVLSKLRMRRFGLGGAKNIINRYKNSIKTRNRITSEIFTSSLVCNVIVM